MNTYVPMQQYSQSAATPAQYNPYGPQVGGAGPYQQGNTTQFPPSSRYPTSGGHHATQYPALPTQYPSHYPGGAYPEGADPFTSPRVNVLAPQYVDLLPGHLPQVGDAIHHQVNGQMCHERVIKEGSHIVHEKVIELPKKVIQERFVEVPQIERKVKYIDVPEIVYQENIVYKKVEQIEQRHVQVPKVRVVERVVEVPEVAYIDVPVEKVIEVPEYREEYYERIVEVPQYQEVPVPEYREVPVNQEIERHLPVPVEVTATFEYRMPCIRPVYKEVPVPIYVPRYIEVPVPAHMMDSNILKNLNDRVNYLSKNPATTRDDLQRLADMSRSAIPNA